MLKLKNINYHPSTSEKPILVGISLEVKKGQPLIISGPSGIGKTSLIEVISGLVAQNEVTITYDDQAITEKQRRKMCGVVFQFPEVSLEDSADLSAYFFAFSIKYSEVVGADMNLLICPDYIKFKL